MSRLDGKPVWGDALLGLGPHILFYVQVIPDNRRDC